MKTFIVDTAIRRMSKNAYIGSCAFKIQIYRAVNSQEVKCRGPIASYLFVSIGLMSGLHVNIGKCTLLVSLNVKKEYFENLLHE